MMQPFSDKTTVAIPGDAPRAERLAAVLDAYMRELEAGGIPPDVESLVTQHPDLADELRSYIDSLKLLHQMTAGLRPMPTRAESPPSGMSPKRLGDYDIVREIGRGGMGIVYEARQLSLNRQVALKVLPFAAMLDEKQIARFRNEAQAAAQLHHPNIVPVHAVGQERGVHFFAMQYVPGQSLEAALQELRNESSEKSPAAPRAGATTVARAGTGAHGAGASHAGLTVPNEPALRDTATFTAFSTRASTRSRGYCQSVARLMIQAADAIQHAHDCGVIHRDVKPSNLLLDRDGKLWVTDFGLARMQSDSGVTMTGDVVGTLRYMSPEQASGAHGLVDARADVYSLGATLYELLTLRPAHSGDNRQAVLRNIESREPTPPRALNPAAPLDLETITLRALAKSRDERYSSAKDFANDLRLFLQGRPTVARRPTVRDRAAKWCLRHRAAVSLVAVALLLITLVSATAAFMTAGALHEAKANLARAERSERQAHEVVDRFGSGVASELAGRPGIEPLRRMWLGETLGYYRRFIKQSEGDPRLRRDLASVCFKAASIADQMGNRREAVDLCRQALSGFNELVRQSPNDQELAIERSKCQSSLGLLLAAESQIDAALQSYATAIDEQRSMVTRGGASADPAAVRALADTHCNLGLLLAQTGRKDAARRSMGEGIALIKKLSARTPGDVALRHDLAISYNSLSFVERDLDWSRAEAACRQAIKLQEQLVKEQDEKATYRADLALFYNNLGAILAHGGDWAAACQSYRQAIQSQEQLQRLAPAVVNYRRDLAVSWNNLGQALDARRRAGEAAEAYDHATGIIEDLVEDYADELTFRSLFGAVLNNRAMALEAAGHRAEALPAFEQAIAQQRIAFDRAPQVAEYRDFLSKHYFNYGRALRAAGQPARAGEMALARRALWPSDGQHLSQVAVELAEAAVLARQGTEDSAAELADSLENEAAETVRAAAAAGGNLAGLRGEAAFQLLRNSTIWTIINGAQTTGAD